MCRSAREGVCFAILVNQELETGQVIPVIQQRPLFFKPLRSEGHLFLTVIAYQLVQVIRKRLKQRGDSSSWTTLRRILEGQQRVTVTFRRGDGRTLHVRKATRAETDQKAIYNALGIDPAPGGVRKMIV